MRKHERRGKRQELGLSKATKRATLKSGMDRTPPCHTEYKVWVDHHSLSFPTGRRVTVLPSSCIVATIPGFI